MSPTPTVSQETSMNSDGLSLFTLEVTFTTGCGSKQLILKNSLINLNR